MRVSFLFILIFLTAACEGRIEVEYDDEIISNYEIGNKKLVNIFEVNCKAH